MYDIEIDYETGNSFGREECTGESVGIVTSDPAKAKENLKRIQEHYAVCRDNPDYGKRYSLPLLTDDGERTISPFWIGYFETLRGAKIVSIDDGLSFTI